MSHGSVWAVIRRGEPVASGGRAVAARPEALALAFEALGREEIPVLGRALAWQIDSAGTR